MSTFNLYSLSKNSLVASLKLGEIFQLSSGVKLRTLDKQGKIFVESESTDNVVVLNDKVVIEMAQGSAGETFSVNDEKYVLLREGQVFLTQNQINSENIGRIHNLSSRALELVERDSENRTLFLVRAALEKKLNAIKIVFMKNNYRVLKISGGALGVFLMLIGTLLLVPTSDTVAAKKVEKKVEVLASKKTTPVVELEEIKAPVNNLKQELDLAKETVSKWKEQFKAAKTTKIEAEKLELYSSLLASGKDNKELWNAYPKHKKVEKYFNIRINKLILKAKSRKASAKTRRESLETLISKKNLLNKSAQTDVALYESSLRKEIRASWVKAAFDPEAVRAELKAVSALLPADHALQQDISEKIEAL